MLHLSLDKSNRWSLARHTEIYEDNLFLQRFGVFPIAFGIHEVPHASVGPGRSLVVEAAFSILFTEAEWPDRNDAASVEAVPGTWRFEVS